MISTTDDPRPYPSPRLGHPMLNNLLINAFAWNPYIPLTSASRPHATTLLRFQVPYLTSYFFNSSTCSCCSANRPRYNRGPNYIWCRYNWCRSNHTVACTPTLNWTSSFDIKNDCQSLHDIYITRVKLHVYHNSVIPGRPYLCIPCHSRILRRFTRPHQALEGQP